MSYANFVQGKLNAAITSAAFGSLSLQTVVAPYQLPPVDGGTLVLTDSLNSPSFVEVIKYASRSGQNLLTLTRAQEGTSARAWPTGTFIYQSLTAGDFSAALASTSDWQYKSGNFRAAIGTRSFITDNSVVSLPLIAGLPQGASLVLGKAHGFTPVVQVTDGATIKAAKASGTSFNYDLPAPITLVLNGTAWEV